MHPEVGYFLLFLSAGLGISTVGLCVAWLRARERWIRSEAKLERGERLASGEPHLAATVDSIALEVERIGESQRFLHQLLANRQSGLLEQKHLRSEHSD